ncbi:hypothetical protein [Halostella litorea]|uniref:hypothetical protein n=1 Tax=Halostella litorea TaxID=2528831 RepID=UPI0010928CB8|nr:hypothetical protein [Halostella litorea]
MRGGRVGEPTDGRRAAGLARLSAGSPVSPRTAAGLVTLLPVALATLYRVALNAPGPLPRPVTAVVGAALPLVVAGPAVAALCLTATADRPGERVGFAFVGGFGLVSLASPAAWLPAVVGTVLGGGLAVGSELARDGRPEARRVGVAGVLVAGVVTSLAASAGVGAATLRPLGSGLALVGVGLTPLLVGGDRTSLAVGALAGVLTFALATSAPYVAGAVLLVGGGVVGAPLGAVAFAVGGGVAGVARALRRGRGDLAVGAGLLLAAGVPATLPRALGVVVALALLVEAGGELP